ncbi:hypothetical protein FRC20_000856 [Serendipita sp. 405]|nr:hypothetical protein FRC20_000856 [Serendipita sp. 405]
MTEPSVLEPFAVPSATLESDEEYKKNLKQLRREWKWAAASDFLYKFNPMLHLDFLDLSDVEHDILSGESNTIMTVFLKILHVLTSIRGLSQDTWEQYLRRLYSRRDPENVTWGTEEVPIAWKDFTWIDRLGILHDLCEWQFQNPLRVRQSMKDDGDEPDWRSSPIGRDARRNEYWHLGRDRLWIKRPVNEPSSQSDLKGKKSPKKARKKSNKRKAMANGNSKPAAPPKTKQPTLDRFFKTSKVATKPQQLSGTRISSRLTRGSDMDGWQKVPDEWLKTPSTSTSNANPEGDGVNDMEALFDDASDLTDLSDDNKPPADSGTGSSKANPPDDSDSELTDMDEDPNEKDEPETKPKSGTLDQDPNSPDFVEFETICVTMSEWKEFAERLKVTRSLNERHLYRYITVVIIPEMEEYQRAVEEKRDKELREMLKREQAAAAAAAAEARPKRSTRLAALVDDDQERRRPGSIDGDSSDGLRGARNPRMRRAALRGARWIAEQEQMLAAMSTEGDDNEDEEEEKQDEEGQQKPRRKRKKQTDQDEYRDEEEEDAEAEQSSLLLNGRGRPRRAAAVQADLKRPVRSTRRRIKESDDEVDSDEPFFLNCEICKKSGWNEDGSQQLISCRDCGILQHMACYDRADKLEGKPKRNWSEEGFLCSACYVKAQNKRPRRGRRHKENPSLDETEAGVLEQDLDVEDKMDIVREDVASSSFTSIQAPPSSRSAGSVKSEEDASMNPVSQHRGQETIQSLSLPLQNGDSGRMKDQQDVFNPASAIAPPFQVSPLLLSPGQATAPMET